MQTYREVEPPRRRSGARLVVLSALVLFVGAVTIDAAVHGDVTWAGIAFFALPTAGFLLLAYVAVKYEAHSVCREIRLSDDGACELVTASRTVRLHASQITKVKYHAKTDDSDESYTIRFAGGKVTVHDDMADFPEFLSRLKRMNPAVDLRSFPEYGWPPRTTESEGPSAAGAIFAVVVVAAVISLAARTLIG